MSEPPGPSQSAKPNDSPASDSEEDAAAASCGERRVILLGASNLARGFSTVIQTSQLMCGCPLEIMTAIGHGRSYGISTTVMGRSLPGIEPCGLWAELERRPKMATAALVTDIGNDLLYEQPVPLIVEWLERCLDRLQAADAQIVMTLLPVANVREISPARFKLMRRLLFPRSQLSLETVRSQVLDLNDRVIRLGERRDVTLIEQQSVWYGFDPIHIRFFQWRHAWRDILQSWSHHDRSPQLARTSIGRWIYLRSLPPQRRALLGREQYHSQPAGRMRDGSTIWLY